MKTACERLTPQNNDDNNDVTIKDEPYSETDSTHSSCPPSPPQFMNTSELHFDVDMKTHNLLKQANIMISSPHSIIPQRCSRLNIKIEPAVRNSLPFHLPPTPPSCSSSEDSEDNATISQPPSPNVRKSGGGRVVMSHHATSRQPIHTPLISSQPVGVSRRRMRILL